MTVRKRYVLSAFILLAGEGGEFAQAVVF